MRRFDVNQLPTGSYSISGSFSGSFLGDGSELTGIIATSASFSTTASYVNPLRQTVELTGSLNITGSTLQVGNNTLLGNTTLSGSIIISGSLGTSSPTVRIYGDTTHNGYIRFDPVTTNINTSISASYIYVSGSTNDLYFAQNGSGYGNVTRLRWLEGNLYTGLLNGGLITATNGTTVYNISSGSGIIVDLNTSLIDNPYPTIEYVNWGNITNIPITLTGSYDQTFVGIGTGGNVVTQGTPFYDGQIDTQIPIGIVLHQNHLNINGVKTQPSVAYGWKQRSNVFISAFGPLKLSGFTLAVSASSTGSLVVGSGTAFQDGANYPLNPDNPSYVTDPGTNVSKIFRYHQSGSNWVYDTNAAAGYGAIDPTQYSLNGVLTPVPTNDWTIQRVYYFTNSVTKAIVVYYGNAHYKTELDAIANLNIEPFTEAPNTAANAVYLGALIVRYNADFNTAASFKIIPGGLFRAIGGSGGGGGSVTQILSGLSDVSITSPTDGQPLAYNASTLKWNNTSSITADLIGNASTATSASFALSGNGIFSGSFSGSFQGDGSELTGIVSASFASTASYATQAVSASYAPTSVTSTVIYSDTTVVTVTGTTAETLIASVPIPTDIGESILRSSFVVVVTTLGGAAPRTRMRIGTIANPSSAQLASQTVLGTNAVGSANAVSMYRTMPIIGGASGDIKSIAAGSNINADYGILTTYTITPVDWTTQQYIYFTIVNNTTAAVTSCYGVLVEQLNT